ncbi:MAG: ArnT family glycosyltransferase [Pseudomonadota bacterium]
MSTRVKWRTRTDRALFFSTLLLFLIVISDVVTRGMMPDGTLYAGIARLLAVNEGSFWFPPTFLPDATSFHDHPPLGLWLQSLAFRVLGDAFWVENAYAAILLVCTCLIIYHLAVAETRRGWYATLMFLIFPLCAFTYTNNFLENTLTLFTLASVATALASVSGTGKAFAWALMSGLMVFAAVLTKGPVGLFPLAVYPLLLLKDTKLPPTGLLKLWLLQLGGVAACTTLMLLSADARTAVTAYIDVQLIATFAGIRPAEYGRLYLLKELGLNLLGPLVYTALLVVAMGQRWHAWSRSTLFYLALGLCASVPLLISPRQYIHYLLPALPYFALAIAVTAAPAVARVQAMLTRTPRGQVTLLALPVVLLLVLLTTFVSRFGNISDDPAQLAAAERLARDLGDTRVVGLCADTQLDLRLRMYLFRYHNIRVDPDSRASGNRDRLICRTGPPDGMAPGEELVIRQARAGT